MFIFFLGTFMNVCTDDILSNNVFLKKQTTNLLQQPLRL